MPSAIKPTNRCDICHQAPLDGVACNRCRPYEEAFSQGVSAAIETVVDLENVLPGRPYEEREVRAAVVRSLRRLRREANMPLKDDRLGMSFTQRREEKD